MTIACLVCDHANEALLNESMTISVGILVHRGRFSRIMVTSLEAIAGRASFSSPATAVVQDANRNGGLSARASFRYTKTGAQNPNSPGRAYNFVKIKHIDT